MVTGGFLEDVIRWTPQVFVARQLLVASGLKIFPLSTYSGARFDGSSRFVGK